MSLDIDWSLLGPTDLRAHLVTLLNNTLSTAPRPSFIGPITVTSFDLGTVAPDVEIKDIRDVWRAFEEGDEDGDAEVLFAAEDARDRSMESPSHVESGLGDEAYEVIEPVYDSSEMELAGMDDTSVVSGFSPRHSIAAVGIGTAFHGLGVRADYASGILSPVPGSFFAPSQVPPSRRGQTRQSSGPFQPLQASSSPASPTAKPAGSSEAKSPIPSLQLHLRVTHTSDLSLTLLTSLSVNYPSPSFMTLPLKLSITGLSLAADVVLAYSGQKHRVHICVVDDEPDAIHGVPIGQRLLPHLTIDSEIGHADAHVLKNVGKVERFIADVVRKTLVDELVFPNFQTIAL